MSTLLITHRVEALRRNGSAPPARIRLGLEVRVKPGEFSLSSTPPGAAAPEDLDAAIGRARAAIVPSLPGESSAELLLEAGVVEQSIARGPSATSSRRRPYLLASHRGVLLELSEQPALPPRARPHLATERPDRDAPVVLGPSAVLGAALELLDLSDASGAPPEAPHAAMAISAGVASPYPPHDAPVLDDGRPAFDPVFLRPEAWSRPFAALPRDAIHSVAVRFAAAAPPPPRSFFVLQSLLPLSTGDGEIEWEAEYTVSDGCGAASLGARPLRMRAAARGLLAAATGSLGKARPALGSDAVWGECYGWAPPILTALRAGDLLA